ncbi:uncharacterized protein BDZ99DRAFT_525833 [Mytilinidion resinicola]|uniref:Uncharacterized protein n=1 Tax=Mytilinidion resinicola TaxID=574789 RepID=A0A6A6Y5X5_9PEZI|nr:uncharacterized protein BDZ99DRAFT_525833 [Mytilinidion resinicola]KAF2804241.1 hypothetical protein BDZ99DRAFT_525833 [Mytilinidion resinicola]
MAYDLAYPLEHGTTTSGLARVDELHMDASTGRIQIGMFEDLTNDFSGSECETQVVELRLHFKFTQQVPDQTVSVFAATYTLTTLCCVLGPLSTISTNAWVRLLALWTLLTTYWISLCWIPRFDDSVPSSRRTAQSLAKLYSQKVGFSVINASKQEVPIAREYFCKLPAESQAIPNSLIQEILDSFVKNPYENGESQKGVEVGVFIIRKSLKDWGGQAVGFKNIRRMEPLDGFHYRLTVETTWPDRDRQAPLSSNPTPAIPSFDLDWQLPAATGVKRNALEAKDIITAEIRTQDIRD